MSDDQQPGPQPPAGPNEIKGPTTPDDGTPVPGRVRARRGIDWIVRGWGYFYRGPLAWTGAMVVLFAINRLLIAAPLLGLVAARVLSPVFTGGMMIGCRTVDAGGRFRFAHLFAGFNDPAASRLAGAGGLELAMTVVLMMIVGMLWVAMGLPMDGSADPAAFQQDPWKLLMPLLIALPAVLPVIMLILFAPALIVLHRMTVIGAMGLSYRGCVRNLLPMFVWVLSGLAIATLAALIFSALVSVVGTTVSGMLMVVLFGGVLGSVYMGSVYAAYVDIFRGPSRSTG